MANRGPLKGMIAHFCLTTPDGIRISSVWETEQDARTGAEDPVLREAFAKAQMPPAAPQFSPCTTMSSSRR